MTNAMRIMPSSIYENQTESYRAMPFEGLQF